jgi:hypothetical protein
MNALTFERDPALADTIRDGLAAHKERENALRPDSQKRSITMNVTTVLLATAILDAARRGDFQVSVEPVTQETNFGPAFEGACAYVRGTENRQVHVYLCDDEPGAEVWMIDHFDTAVGDPDPKALTPANLNAAMEWLLGNAP